MFGQEVRISILKLSTRCHIEAHKPYESTTCCSEGFRMQLHKDHDVDKRVMLTVQISSLNTKQVKIFFMLNRKDQNAIIKLSPS
jgi:hypothetical protein